MTVEGAAASDGAGLGVTARVKTTGPTGVEMEALTAVSVACLTLYDMLKAADKAMTIGAIRLLEKTGDAGLSELEVTLTNTGTLLVSSGTLQVDAISNLAGGTLTGEAVDAAVRRVIDATGRELKATVRA